MRGRARGLASGPVGAALLLTGCASVPPELADPVAHIRPIQNESTEIEVPDLLARGLDLMASEPARACEFLRRAAQGGERAALDPLVACVFESGDTTRAHAIADSYAVSPPERLVLDAVRRAEAGRPLDEVALNAALEADPGDARLWNLLGAEYERQGRDAEAVDAYVQAKRVK